MSKESQTVPIGEQTREVKVREVNGQTVLVLVDHEGREDAVPVRLADKPLAKRAA